MSSSNTFTVTTDDGWDLVVSGIPAHGEVHGVAICGHAMMCNRRTLDRPEGAGLGSTLAECGLHTYLVDLRGHGDTGGPLAGITYDDFIVFDIPAVVRHISALHPGLPVTLVGHSLTGHVGVAAVGIDPTLPLAAIVNLAGNLWTRDTEPGLAMWLEKRFVMETWIILSRLFGRFPARLLRYGTDDEALTYVEQLVGNMRQNRWASKDGNVDYLKAMVNITLPILSVVGSRDRQMCRPESARLWLNNAVNAPVTHRVVGYRPGDPTNIDHMGLVTNLCMKSVWHEIGDWIRTATGSDD